MSYPPEGCSYLVHYPDGRSTASATFPDEFALGEWFLAMEATERLSRTDRGLSVWCVTDAGRVAIDVMHPRLVRGRIEKRPASR